MRSNYKRLGQYIKPVNKRNNDLKVRLLLGVSIQKVFIKSIANTVGTNFKSYKVVKKDQFAYGPVTSRNGDKISVALLEEDECIISSSYTVFRIIDKEVLLPEYLMMWFRRPEFDRYARYMSHGSVREIFGWEEMCNVELPIPDIEKQREIVEEYNTIVNRIELNKQLNQKLEETAQALYRHWFVDFEFPNEEGKPYKSSGGEMEYDEELDDEIPTGWKYKPISQIGKIVSGATPSKAKNEYYTNNGIPWITPKDLNQGTKKFINKGAIDITELGYKKSSTKKIKRNSVMISSRAPIGYLAINIKEVCSNQGFKSIVPRYDEYTKFLYYCLKENMERLVGEGTGTTFDEINVSMVSDFYLLCPDEDIIRKFDTLLKTVFSFQINCEQLESQLIVMSELLLQKLAV